MKQYPNKKVISVTINDMFHVSKKDLEKCKEALVMLQQYIRNCHDTIEGEDLATNIQHYRDLEIVLQEMKSQGYPKLEKEPLDHHSRQYLEYYRELVEQDEYLKKRLRETGVGELKESVTALYKATDALASAITYMEDWE